MFDIKSKQKIEIEFWKDSKTQSPESNSIYNIVNKMSDAAVFLDCLDRHRDKLPKAGRILELGAGQGWASCIYKRLFPKTQVITTDISPFAVKSVCKWEKIFEVTIDKAYACKSYDIFEEDSSLDLIFCFSAAHHFLAHKRTLEEIMRKLGPGGRAIYFYEPATPKLFYQFVCRCMNKKRPAVPEDVLIISELQKLAQNIGFAMEVDYSPSLIKRGPFETIYFYILGRLPFLQMVFPCSVNIIFNQKLK